MAPSILINQLVASMVYEENVACAISSFEHDKSTKMFTRSYAMAGCYLQMKWRAVRLVFIPKVGMVNHNTSFLLKTLKLRPLEVYIFV